MSISEITCADDLAALAIESVEQFRKDKQYRDLISAILMANHVADWFYMKDLGQKSFGDPDREAMKSAYPEWDILRQLANGVKHCKLKDKYGGLDWEHCDYWSSAGHVGRDWHDWFVEVNGKERSVVVLIETFLNAFSDHAARPKYVKAKP